MQHVPDNSQSEKYRKDFFLHIFTSVDILKYKFFLDVASSRKTQFFTQIFSQLSNPIQSKILLKLQS